MLVLSRKLGESIVIGDNVTVKVIAIENGVVKLGIDAPKEIAIIRDELIQELKEQNILALHKTDPRELNALSQLLKK